MKAVNSFGPRAEGEFFEHFGRNVPHTGGRFAETGEDEGALGAAAERFADEHLGQFNPRIHRAGNLTRAVDDRPALLFTLPPLAQLGRVLHALAGFLQPLPFLKRISEAEGRLRELVVAEKKTVRQ